MYKYPTFKNNVYSLIIEWFDVLIGDPVFNIVFFYLQRMCVAYINLYHTFVQQCNKQSTINYNSFRFYTM